MLPLPFNFRGYTKPDPLDNVPGKLRTPVVMFVNLILSVVLIYLITKYEIVYYNGFTILDKGFSPVVTMALEVIIAVFIFAPLLVLLRKSSSIVHLLLVFCSFYFLDLYLEAHVRHEPGSTALWDYYPGSFVSGITIPALKFFVTISADAIVFGPIALFLSRLTALLFPKTKTAGLPTKEQYDALFPAEWADEKVEKPKRDAGYWILRLLGIGYVTYLSILVLGSLGSTVWPAEIAKLISSTYSNPALGINTFLKISVMVLLAFTGAYNRNARWYCALSLLIGHAFSTVFSLAFYYVVPPPNGIAADDFLLVSAVVDGVMILLFAWIMIRSYKDRVIFSREQEIPASFSVPSRLNRIMYTAIGIYCTAMVGVVLVSRLVLSSRSDLGAIYGHPDPFVGNTVTLFGTMALIAFMLVRRNRLRRILFGVLLFPLTGGVILTTIWFIIGSITSSMDFDPRSGSPPVSADWYYLLYIVVCAVIAAVMLSFRKMYYNVDFVITAVNPSSAKNIIALTNSFFGGDSKHHSAVLQSIDQFSGGMRGRKRGLLNLPFWAVENVFNFIFGLHPTFSTMSVDEQRWFLRKYMLRLPHEKKKAFIPLLAEISWQIGMAVNAMVMFANYSYIKARKDIGYIPFDARDRVQGDYADYPPPFKGIAPLPKSEKDPLNDKPDSRGKKKLIAPRVTTAIDDPPVPEEADYVIVGSGAGGAVMAYRLACTVKDPSKIMLVERGMRYQPLQDFNDFEIEMMRKLYKEGGLQQTKKANMSVLQGECLGGTTVVNNAVCFELADNIRRQWSEDFNIDLRNINKEYARIAEEIEIDRLDSLAINTKAASKFEKAVAEYNASPAQDKLVTDYPVKVNYRNAPGEECWNLGNKRLRKRSMLETYIPWAEARGVNIISNMTALNLVMENGKASAINLRTENGEIKKVKVNKAVIIAGGVISSSHLLMRSDLCKNTGKNMSCNFAFPIAFEFDEIIDAFDGNQITLGALDPQGRAVFETYFNPPAAFALASVPFSFDKRISIMSNYRKLLNFGTLIGSEPNGIINEKADIINGQAFDWELGDLDRSNIRYAFSTLLELGMHAGAKRVILPTKPGLDIKITPENIRRFNKAFHDYPLSMDDLGMATAHPQGGNRMAGSNSRYKSTRVVTEDYRVEGCGNVFVSDASLFPTSMCLNPQFTIMAMSSMASKKVVELCG